MHAIVACEKQEHCHPLRQVLINCGVDCRADDAVLYDNLLPRINRGGAELLVVVLGAKPQAALRLVAEVHGKAGLPILVAGPSDDAQIIMQSMKAGAREYLDAGLLRENIVKAVEKLRQTGAIQFRRGNCIAVTSALPGSGVTTIASGLAFALGAMHPNQVVLSEFGASVPELAFDLDVVPPNSMSQLASAWDRVDASTIRQAAIPHPNGIFLLADSEGANRTGFGDPNASRQLTSLIRTMFDYAVYDLGHASQTPATEQVIRLADKVVLVVRLDVPSLKLTRHLLNHFTDLAIPQEKLIVVANRYGQSGQIAWRKVEESLGIPVQMWMPDDPSVINQALNLGVPFMQVSSWSKFIRRLNELCAASNAAPAK